MDYINGRQTSRESRSETKAKIIKSDLFNMVMIGGDKTFDESKLKKKIANEDISTFKMKSKQLYFSYLARAKSNNK